LESLSGLKPPFGKPDQFLPPERRTVFSPTMLFARRVE
jgi:hypothetical protein